MELDDVGFAVTELGKDRVRVLAMTRHRIHADRYAEQIRGWTEGVDDAGCGLDREPPVS